MQHENPRREDLNPQEPRTLPEPQLHPHHRREAGDEGQVFGAGGPPAAHHAEPALQTGHPERQEHLFPHSPGEHDLQPGQEPLREVDDQPHKENAGRRVSATFRGGEKSDHACLCQAGASLARHLQILWYQVSLHA